MGFREKACEKCGDPYAPTGGNQRVCPSCGAGDQAHRRRRGLARNPWVREQESRICRQCGAEPGLQCVTSVGTFLMRPHMERFADAGGTAEQNTQAESDRRRKANARRRVFAHYGTTCACCGTAENLTIDHINGDGKQHRAEIGEDSHTIYRWLISNDFPPDFQTLCRPCNNSKRNSASCRLLHIPTCPTCHRPFAEEEAVDSRGRRVWAQGGSDTDSTADLQESA